AIGTSPRKIDTDSDGIDDFAAVAQRLDPLGGHAVPIGVVAGAALNGEARQVVVEGSTQNAQSQTAYVATGSYGLAIVDVSQFNQPIVLSQLPLPGDSVDVAVDTVRDLAVVASGAAGVHVVNVSDPMHPTRIGTI